MPRWQSGLTRQPGKLVGANPRGFESSPGRFSEDYEQGSNLEILQEFLLQKISKKIFVTPLGALQFFSIDLFER